MKKVILSITLLSALVLSSCGKSEICGCAETGLNMLKEFKAAKGDPKKIMDAEKKYKADLEKCNELDKGKSEKEKKAMMDELKECDSYKEIKALQNDLTPH